MKLYNAFSSSRDNCFCICSHYSVNLTSEPGFETTNCLNKSHLTCKDYRFNERMVYGFECIPAYVCPGKKVLYNSHCIEPKNCPCYDKNGIEWLIGSAVPSEIPGKKW